MKFGYVESHKPTRGERSWVIGVAEASFNINYVAVYFVIYETIASRINNRFVQRKLTGEKTNSTAGNFHSDHIKTRDFLQQTSFA